MPSSELDNRPQAATKKYFDALDGLRGLAALGVALFHWLLSFAGYLAVDFFLVLSGFILAHRYLHGRDGTGSGRFVLARLARLYPMHLFGLLSYALVLGWITGQFPRYPDGTLFTLVQQLTLTHNIGLNQHGLTWNAPAWSISVEFWLNLLFFCCIGRQTKSLSLLLLSVASLVLIHSQTGHLDTTYQNYFQALNSGLLRGWASFMLGVLAYRAYRRIALLELDRKLLSVAEMLAVIAALLLVFGLRPSSRPLELFAPFVFAALVLLFSLQQGLLSHLAAKLKWLGTISYSIYLNHLIVLMLVDTYLGGRLGVEHASLTPVYLALLLLYSRLTYSCIEVPGKQLLLRLGTLFRSSEANQPVGDEAQAGPALAGNGLAKAGDH